MAQEKVVTELERCVEQARKARDTYNKGARDLLRAIELGSDEPDAEQTKYVSGKAREFREASRAQERAVRIVGEQYLASVGWGGDR